MLNILLTGGTGTLGGYLVPLLRKNHKVDAPSSMDLNITKPFEKRDYDMIVHLAAFTDVLLAETEKFKCYYANVFGTLNLLKSYYNKPFVYLSTEDAHNPVNYYSETKLAAEVVVKALAKRYLIIRTLFKAVPYPYDQAFIDRYTCGDEVTIIAPLLAKAIEDWDKKSKLIYVGTERKTFYDFAVKSRPDVKKCSVNDIKGVKLPHDSV